MLGSVLGRICLEAFCISGGRLGSTCKSGGNSDWLTLYQERDKKAVANPLLGCKLGLGV
jgi:hypothetical protein